MFYNRKQRRKIAKDLGLFKIEESQAKREERVRRAIEAGEQIHAQFLANMEAEQRRAAQDAAERGPMAPFGHVPANFVGGHGNGDIWSADDLPPGINISSTAQENENE